MGDLESESLEPAGYLETLDVHRTSGTVAVLGRTFTGIILRALCAMLIIIQHNAIFCRYGVILVVNSGALYFW